MDLGVAYRAVGEQPSSDRLVAVNIHHSARPGGRVVRGVPDQAVPNVASQAEERHRLLGNVLIAAGALAPAMLIATDSIPATINVGQDVPTLSSQALTGAQAGGSSLFANTISTRSSGVTLNVVARVSPSGIVTMVVSQDVSTPQAPAAGKPGPSPIRSRTW